MSAHVYAVFNSLQHHRQLSAADRSAYGSGSPDAGGGGVSVSGGRGIQNFLPIAASPQDVCAPTGNRTVQKG